MSKTGIAEAIRNELFENQDINYRDFQAKLIPDIDSKRIIGVRTPLLRAMAKRLSGNVGTGVFLSDLPHRYFEENQLHSFIILQEKDFQASLKEIDRFLPYVDNWATCDQLCPKAFAKNKDSLIPAVDRWLSSDGVYTVRFGIKTLMQFFLDKDFDEKYLEKVAATESTEYYVRMMVAWYFATALAKQYDCAIKYIENGRLGEWVHNKTVRKAIESYRITPEQKEYLKTLVRKRQR